VSPAENSNPPSGETISTDRCLTHIRDAAHGESNWYQEKARNARHLVKTIEEKHDDQRRKRKEHAARVQETHSSHLLPSVQIHEETDLKNCFSWGGGNVLIHDSITDLRVVPETSLIMT